MHTNYLYRWSCTNCTGDSRKYTVPSLKLIGIFVAPSLVKNLFSSRFTLYVVSFILKIRTCFVQISHCSTRSSYPSTTTFCTTIQSSATTTTRLCFPVIKSVLVLPTRYLRYPLHTALLRNFVRELFEVT